MKKVSIGFFSVGLDGGFDSKVAASNFKAAVSAFKLCAKENGFTPVVEAGIVYTRKQLSAFFDKCDDARVSAIVLHTSSFTAGDLGQESAWYASRRGMPFLIWGVPDPEGGTLPVNNFCCANFMCSVFYSMGAKFKWLWGTPGSPEVAAEIAATARCASAIESLRGAALCVIGSSRVPGFYGSNFSEPSVKSRFGAHVDKIELTSFYKLCESANPSRVKSAAEKITSLQGKCRPNAADVTASARAYVALKQLAKDAGYSGLAVRCWPEFRDDIGIEMCIPMALMGDDGIPCSCESDIPGLISMLLQYELTARKQGPPSLLDMVSLDAKGSSVGLWHCGVCSPSLAASGSTCVVKHSIVEENNPCAKMGLLLESCMKPGTATVFRVQDEDCSRYLAVSGEVLKRKPRFRGSYGEFKPVGMSASDLANTVMTQGLTHHYSISYSDHLSLLEETAYWLGLKRIEAVPASGHSAGFGKV